MTDNKKSIGDNLYSTGAENRTRCWRKRWCQERADTSSRVISSQISSSDRKISRFFSLVPFLVF